MYLDVYLNEYIFRFLTLSYYPVLEFMQLRRCDMLILNFKIDFASLVFPFSIFLAASIVRWLCSLFSSR